MIDFKLPSLGADMDSGTLLSWHVKPGDTVKRGQVVAVVDTSKAAVDVEIWQEGVLHALLVQPGEKVPVGTVLAHVLAPGESAPVPQDATATKPSQVPMPAQAPAPVLPTPQAEPVPSFQPAPKPVRHPVSPAARQRAKALGINPDVVQGSGAQGAVTLADIEAAAQSRAHPAAAVAQPAQTSAPPTATDRQREMRKAIAAAMSRSKREIPHYYLSETIPMTRALGWLQEHNAELPITTRILSAALLLKAVARALQRTPELNGFYVAEHFTPSAPVHAGVAISLRGGGLVAPALHDVDTKPLAQLMHELADLVKRARAGSLRSSEMSDPTITVTNLGEQSVQSVLGVIYPPQVALVGLGQIAMRPWVESGQLVAAPLLCATLAADHRASDGHRGALFLAELREVLQQPHTLDELGTPAPTPIESLHMTPDRQKLTDTVLTLLCAIAPEIEPATLVPHRPLRQQVDLDSMDWLNFLVSLHEHLGVTILESDYAALVCLDDVLNYLQGRLTDHQHGQK